MERPYRRAAYAGGGGQEDDPQTSSENGGPDSPLSGDDPAVTATATTTAPSPKKSRRSIQKRVVSVPIADVEGSSSYRNGRGEAYPPSDSWAWRKYGQKPIKGSPYPRGYYRCSSSKGCPARKQVERSRVDPTMLVITYASEHNHPQPTSSKHHHLQQHHHHQNPATTTTRTTAADRDSSSSPPSGSPTTTTPSPPRTRIRITTTDKNSNKKVRLLDTKTGGGLINNNNSTTPNDSTTQNNDDVDVYEEKPPSLFSTGPNDLGLCGGGDHTLMDFSWLSEVAFEGLSYVGPRCIIDDDAHDVGISSYVDVKMREEDEKLFADLDELPECSAVFKSTAMTRGVDRCNQLGGPPSSSANTAAPVCGGTGC